MTRFFPVLSGLLLLSACGGDGQSYEQLYNRFNDIDSRATAEHAMTTSVMPTSGTASYSGTAAFLFPGQTTADTLAALKMQADFGSSTMTGSMTNFVRADGSAASGSLSVSNGVISGNGYSGDVSGQVKVNGITHDFLGSLFGSFYRPDASLIDADLTMLSHTTGETVTGFGAAEK